jgi:hypothetical protein
MKELIFSTGHAVFPASPMTPDPIISQWSAAKAAYEEDCRRCPCYPDGAARPGWYQLDVVAQDSWYRNPHPREFSR